MDNSLYFLFFCIVPIVTFLSCFSVPYWNRIGDDSLFEFGLRKREEVLSIRWVIVKMTLLGGMVQSIFVGGFFTETPFWIALSWALVAISIFIPGLIEIPKGLDARLPDWATSQKRRRMFWIKTLLVLELSVLVYGYYHPNHELAWLLIRGNSLWNLVPVVLPRVPWWKGYTDVVEQFDREYWLIPLKRWVYRVLAAGWISLFLWMAEGWNYGVTTIIASAVLFYLLYEYDKTSPSR